MQFNKWYYEKDNKPTGPISETDLIDKIDSGEIKRDTLLWTEPIRDWSPASQVQQFSMHFPPIPPPLPSAKDEIKTPNSTNIPFISNLPKEQVSGGSVEVNSGDIEDVNQIRPWVRFFARFFDIYLFGFLLGIIISIIYPKFTEGPTRGSTIVFVLVSYFLWVFIEPIFLSSYAATPGKYLLGTRVVDSSGNNLTYYAALKRSFKVWFLGLACGTPLISLITLAAAHHKLTKTGKTTWDQDGDCIVKHKKIGQLNELIFITLIAIMILLDLWFRITLR